MLDARCWSLVARESVVGRGWFALQMIQVAATECQVTLPSRWQTHHDNSVRVLDVVYTFIRIIPNTGEYDTRTTISYVRRSTYIQNTKSVRTTPYSRSAVYTVFGLRVGVLLYTSSYY